MRIAFDDNFENFDFYPTEYLQMVANYLECELSNLMIVSEIGEMEEIEDMRKLNKVLHGYSYESSEEIVDDFEGLTIGSAEKGQMLFYGIKAIKTVAEQNASPIGIWIDKKDLEHLKVLIK